MGTLVGDAVAVAVGVIPEVGVAMAGRLPLATDGAGVLITVTTVIGAPGPLKSGLRPKMTVTNSGTAIMMTAAALTMRAVGAIWRSTLAPGGHGQRRPF